jgi:hypothetical protein
MERIFRSRLVNYGVRGAIGFAIAFFVASLFERFIYQKFEASSEAIENLLLDLFRASIPGNAVFLISFFVSVLVTGLLFGIVAALLFAERSRYSRYIVASMVGWFLRFGVSNVVDETLGNMSFYLGTKHANYLTTMLWVLSCAFLGLIFVVARSRNKWPYRCFVVGAFVYPLLFYFYIRLLFWIGWIETPYLFIALAALVVICIASVFVIAIKSEDMPRIPWTFLVFAIGFPLTAYGTGFILQHFVPSWQALISASFSASQNWRQIFLLAMVAGLFEVPLGIFVGVTLGFQKKSAPPQLTANN